jgi:hypothetical protein
MLEITGEYIPLKETAPEVTRAQKFWSYLWPLKFRGTAEGADWVRYLYFDTDYTLRRGKLRVSSKRLVHTEDLREKQEREKREGKGL